MVSKYYFPLAFTDEAKCGTVSTAGSVNGVFCNALDGSGTLCTV
jgi:hypothetical protein